MNISTILFPKKKEYTLKELEKQILAKRNFLKEIKQNQSYPVYLKLKMLESFKEKLKAQLMKYNEYRIYKNQLCQSRIKDNLSPIYNSAFSDEAKPILTSQIQLNEINRKQVQLFKSMLQLSKRKNKEVQKKNIEIKQSINKNPQLLKQPKMISISHAQMTSSIIISHHTLFHSTNASSDKISRKVNKCKTFKFSQIKSSNFYQNQMIEFLRPFVNSARQIVRQMMLLNEKTKSNYEKQLEINTWLKQVKLMDAINKVNTKFDKVLYKNNKYMQVYAKISSIDTFAKVETLKPLSQRQLSKNLSDRQQSQRQKQKNHKVRQDQIPIVSFQIKNANPQVELTKVKEFKTKSSQQQINKRYQKQINKQDVDLVKSKEVNQKSCIKLKENNSSTILIQQNKSNTSTIISNLQKVDHYIQNQLVLPEQPQIIQGSQRTDNSTIIPNCLYSQEQINQDKTSFPSKKVDNSVMFTNQQWKQLSSGQNVDFNYGYKSKKEQMYKQQSQEQRRYDRAPSQVLCNSNHLDNSFYPLKINQKINGQSENISKELKNSNVLFNGDNQNVNFAKNLNIFNNSSAMLKNKKDSQIRSNQKSNNSVFSKKKSKVIQNKNSFVISPTNIFKSNSGSNQFKSQSTKNNMFSPSYTSNIFCTSNVSNSNDKQNMVSNTSNCFPQQKFNNNPFQKSETFSNEIKSNFNVFSCKKQEKQSALKQNTSYFNSSIQFNVTNIKQKKCIPQRQDEDEEYYYY